MAFPSVADKVGLGVLDARCESRQSLDSTLIVAFFSQAHLEHRKDYLSNVCVFDLPHLARCILEAGVQVDAVVGPNRDLSPLLIAGACGSTRVLKVLLEAGAQHALVNDSKASALHLSAAGGHAACIAMLVEAGANPDAHDWLGNTTLMLAVMNNHVECARTLVNVSDTLSMDIQGNTAFHLSVCSDYEVFELLLPLMNDVDVRTAQGVTPDGEPFGLWNQTALHASCGHGQQPKAKALLKRGADRMARNNLNQTPLHRAAQMGSLSCAVLLLKNPSPSFKVDAVDDFHCTSLHYAAMFAHEKICGVLIAAGARLDARTRQGSTPMMLALQEHPTNAPLLALLSGRGPANPPGTVCDHCSKTPEQASVKILKACGGCQAARFCSAACLAAAWPGHKQACKERSAEVAARAAPKLFELPSPQARTQ